MPDETDSASGSNPTPPEPSPALRIHGAASAGTPPAPSAPEFYLLRDGAQTGPFTRTVVESLLRSGAADPRELGWREGQPAWQPLAELFPGVEAVEGTSPGQSGEAAATSAGTSADEGFASRLFGVLAYPFQGEGLIILGSGVVFFLVAGLVAQFLGIVSFIIGLFLVGYLFGALQLVVQSSAQGEDELPRWPDFTGWSSEILQPFVLWLATLAFCFGPAAVVGWWGWRPEDPSLRNPTILGVAAALGLVGYLYYPMALLGVAMADSLTGLRPGLVLRSIAVIPGRYAATVALLTLLLAVQAGGGLVADQAPVPFAGTLWHSFNSLYFALVQARLLGVLYHANKQRLDWI